MKKLVLFVECGVGTKSVTAYLVSEETSEDHLSDYAWEAAVQHAESYGIYPESHKPEDWDNIEGWWEEYNSEKHDGYLLFGSSNEVHWTEL